VSNGGLKVEAMGLNNRLGQMNAQGMSLELRGDQGLNNSSGAMVSSWWLDVSSSGAVNNQEGKLMGGEQDWVARKAYLMGAGMSASAAEAQVAQERQYGYVKLQSSGAINNTSGLIASGRDAVSGGQVLIEGTGLNNSSGAISGEGITINLNDPTQGLNNTSGKIESGLWVGISSSGAVDNTSGVIKGGQKDWTRVDAFNRGQYSRDVVWSSIVAEQIKASDGAWTQTKAVMDANKESLVEGFYTGSLEDSKRGSYVWVNVGGGLGKRGELNNTNGLIEGVRDVKLWLGGFDNAGSVLSQELSKSGAVVNTVVGRGTIGFYLDRGYELQAGRELRGREIEVVSSGAIVNRGKMIADERVWLESWNENQRGSGIINEGLISAGAGVNGFVMMRTDGWVRNTGEVCGRE
jgi:filamentous hemagglutinin